MNTYRVGNHQPQNVYRGEQYIGVMFTAEDAALVVEALNGVERVHGPALPIVTGHTCTGPAACWADPYCPVYSSRKQPADSCTCVYRPSGGADPACPVHQGRRARGPKPPPVGEGCICDGSGRTCPRHGAVL